MDSTPTAALDDLARTQHAWRATYEALAAPANPYLNTLLRRRLLRLSTRLVRLRQRTCHAEGEAE